MAKKTSNELTRKRIWPDVDESLLWMTNKRVGFTQVPRGLSIVNRIIDRLSVGKPLSGVYFSLWCNLFDNAVVRVDNPLISSFEAGFGGPRAVTTWKSRIKVLVDLGFIKTAPGPSGEFGYILIMDPYNVIQKLKNDNKLVDMEPEFNALMDKVEKAGSKKQSDGDLAEARATFSNPLL